MDLLTEPLVGRALFAGAYVSVLCAVVGVFLCLRKLSLVGDGLSHTGFTGAALGIYLGIDPFFTAILVGSFIAIVIALLSRSKIINQDALFGILIAFSLAGGVILLSKSDSHTGSVYQFLFGNIFAITRTELLQGAVFSLVILAVIFCFRMELIFCAVDEQNARIAGVSIRAISFLFFVALAFTVVISQKLVGSVLVSSLLIIPPAISLLYVKDIKAAFLFSALLSLFISLSGILISIFLDTPTGATIAIFGTVVFLISYLFKVKTA